MTIKASGTALAMSEINAEFGLGTNLAAYRGVTWYDGTTGAAGVFDSTSIDFNEFYNKSATPLTLTVVMKDTNCSGTQYACGGGTTSIHTTNGCGTNLVLAACVSGGSGNYAYAWTRTNTNDVDICSGGSSGTTFTIAPELSFGPDNEVTTVTVVVTDTTYTALSGSCAHTFLLIPDVE